MTVGGRHAVSVGFLLVVGCTSVTRIATNDAADETRDRRFRVECIELERCKDRAADACGSSYTVESEWRNPIPESDLPGLNEGSRPKDARDWERYTFPYATGIESPEPMPLVSIVVACSR